MRLSMTYNSATAPLVRNNSNCVRIYSIQLRLISFHKNNQGILVKKSNLKDCLSASTLRSVIKANSLSVFLKRILVSLRPSFAKINVPYFFLIVPSRDVNKNVRSEHRAVLPQAAKREKS